MEELSNIRKDVLKLLLYFTQARKHRINQEAWTSQRGFEMGALKDREKMLDRKLASERKELTDGKVQNVSLRWSCRNVHEKIEALEKDAGVAFKAVDVSAHQNVTQVAHPVEAAFSRNTGNG